MENSEKRRNRRQGQTQTIEQAVDSLDAALQALNMNQSLGSQSEPRRQDVQLGRNTVIRQLPRQNGRLGRNTVVRELAVPPASQADLPRVEVKSENIVEVNQSHNQPEVPQVPAVNDLENQARRERIPEEPALFHDQEKERSQEQRQNVPVPAENQRNFPEIQRRILRQDSEVPSGSTNQQEAELQPFRNSPLQEPLIGTNGARREVLFSMTEPRASQAYRNLQGRNHLIESQEPGISELRINLIGQQLLNCMTLPEAQSESQLFAALEKQGDSEFEVSLKKLQKDLKERREDARKQREKQRQKQMDYLLRQQRVVFYRQQQQMYAVVDTHAFLRRRQMYSNNPPSQQKEQKRERQIKKLQQKQAKQMQEFVKSKHKQIQEEFKIQQQICMQEEAEDLEQVNRFKQAYKQQKRKKQIGEQIKAVEQQKQTKQEQIRIKEEQQRLAQQKRKQQQEQRKKQQEERKKQQEERRRIIRQKEIDQAAKSWEQRMRWQGPILIMMQQQREAQRRAQEQHMRQMRWQQLVMQRQQERSLNQQRERQKMEKLQSIIKQKMQKFEQEQLQIERQEMRQKKEEQQERLQKWKKQEQQKLIAQNQFQQLMHTLRRDQERKERQKRQQKEQQEIRRRQQLKRQWLQGRPIINRSNSRSPIRPVQQPQNQSTEILIIKPDFKEFIESRSKGRNTNVPLQKTTNSSVKPQSKLQKSQNPTPTKNREHKVENLFEKKRIDQEKQQSQEKRPQSISRNDELSTDMQPVDVSPNRTVFSPSQNQRVSRNSPRPQSPSLLSRASQGFQSLARSVRKASQGARSLAESVGRASQSVIRALGTVRSFVSQILSQSKSQSKSSRDQRQNPRYRIQADQLSYEQQIVESFTYYINQNLNPTKSNQSNYFMPDSLLQDNKQETLGFQARSSKISKQELIQSIEILSSLQNSEEILSAELNQKQRNVFEILRNSLTSSKGKTSFTQKSQSHNQQAKDRQLNASNFVKKHKTEVKKEKNKVFGFPKRDDRKSNRQPLLQDIQPYKLEGLKSKRVTKKKPNTQANTWKKSMSNLQAQSNLLSGKQPEYEYAQPQSQQSQRKQMVTVQETRNNSFQIQNPSIFKKPNKSVEKKPKPSKSTEKAKSTRRNQTSSSKPKQIKDIKTETKQEERAKMNDSK